MTSSTNPFGLLAFLSWNNDWNHFHFPAPLLNKALRQIKDLNPSMLRIDILWDEVQPESDRFDFSKYDKLIEKISDLKIGVLAVLQYNRPKPGETRGEVWNKPPDSMADFSRYVEKTVAHFKKTIAHWEIWNEPNLSHYWNAPKDGLKAYSRLLKTSYAAAKRADPSCFVLNGGLTHPIMEDLRNLYENGSRNDMDVVNLHTFYNPEDNDALDAFHRTLRETASLMDHYGDTTKKIWITEMGCPGVPPGRTSPLWFAGRTSDENRQKDWLGAIYEAIEDHPKVEKLFWAFYRDTDGEFRDGTDYLGLVRHDFTPKPAFHRYRELARRAVEGQRPTST